jgi:hypothetical protein
MSDSSTGRIVRRSAFALVFAAAAMALPATQANAVSASGACSTTQGFFANFAVDYHNASGWHYPDRYRWNIGVGGHALGARSNVRAEIRDTSQQQLHHTWVSGDNVRRGVGTSTIPDSVRVQGGRKMFGRFEFVFDWPDHSDPKCAGVTQTV